jgi:hypothetical protein
MLIRSTAVRKDLGLTQAQADRILRIDEEFNKRRREAAQGLRKDASGVDPTELMTMIASLRAENEAAIAEVLEPRQRKRLAQIVIRAEGPLAVSRPEVADAINLGPSEVEYIQEVMREYKEVADRLWQEHIERLRDIRDRAIAAPRGREKAGRIAGAKAPGGEPGRPGDALPSRDPATVAEEERFRKESIKLEDEVIRQVSKALSRKQRAAFNRLLGEPFDLGKLSPDVAGATRSTLSRSSGGGATLPPQDAPAELEPITPKGDTGPPRR